MKRGTGLRPAHQVVHRLQLGDEKLRIDLRNGGPHCTSIAAGIARDAHRPLVRAATGESIGKVDLFTAGIGERGDALVCDDADDLDPFGLGCADAYQDAFADRGFVRERLRRQHLIHDHQISSGIAIGLGEGPAGQQAGAQRVEIPRSNDLPVDRLALRVVGERLLGTPSGWR